MGEIREEGNNSKGKEAVGGLGEKKEDGRRKGKSRLRENEIFKGRRNKKITW